MATVWLVDDDEVDALIVARGIAAVRPDVEVVVLESATACRDRLATGQTPALLLIDWILPPDGGLALLESLVDRRIPIAVLSGSKEPGDAEAALAAGARAWVTKPTRPAAIREVLREALDELLGSG